MSIKFNNLFKTLLIVLLMFLAMILRTYKLDQMPPSLNWDEAAAAYNAFSIANFGKDEYAKSFPLVFKNFGDDKHPIHIYTTALFFRIFGTNDFIARLPDAIFGVFTVLLIFFLVRLWFKSYYLGFLAALFIAISPYHIHYSRGLWEVIYSLFYFVLGLLGFYKGLKKKNWWLVLGFVSFGISLLTYHSAKVVTLPMVLILTLLYFKDLMKMKKIFYTSFFFFMIFIVLIALNPALLGLARVSQTKLSDEYIQKTLIFKQTHLTSLGYLEVVASQYLKHFNLDYLFVNGDQTPRDSVKTFGMYYKIDALFLIVGLIYLLWKRSKISIVLLAWLILAPLPSSMAAGAPSSHRALYMMGSMNILAAVGAYVLTSMLKKVHFKIFISLIIFIILGFSLRSYLGEYYGKYAQEAIQWQYGMKQIVEYVKAHPEYSRVYMSDVRSQPYIFFLYYLKIPPDQLQKTVVYNNDPKNKSYNLIYSFDRYQFGGWDEVSSMPDPNLLYIIEEGKYGGLAHKNDFLVVKDVKFPMGGVAFYMVSAN